MHRVVVRSRPVSFRAVSDCMGRRGLQRVIQKALKTTIQKVIQKALKTTIQKVIQATIQATIQTTRQRAQQPKR